MWKERCLITDIYIYILISDSYAYVLKIRTTTHEGKPYAWIWPKLYSEHHLLKLRATELECSREYGLWNDSFETWCGGTISAFCGCFQTRIKWMMTWLFCGAHELNWLEAIPTQPKTIHDKEQCLANRIEKYENARVCTSVVYEFLYSFHLTPTWSLSQYLCTHSR